MDDQIPQAQSAAPEPAATVPETDPVASATPALAPDASPVATEMKDRSREQFEKLLDSNRRLFEANEYLRRQVDKRQESGKVFEPITAQTSQEPVDSSDFMEVDEAGNKFINESKFKLKLQEIQGRANRAEQTVQSYIKTSEEREIDRQNKEAFGVYAELNPSAPNFDLGFHKLVRGALYDSMNFADENGGRPFTFKEAADFVRAQIPKPVPAPTPTEVKPTEQENAQVLKEQGSAQASSQPHGQTTISDDEELEKLRVLTRYGGKDGDDALVRRILNTDHTKIKSEET